MLLGKAYRRWKRWTRRAGRLFNDLAAVNEAPVLVLGPQKSGTTVIAVLLARYAGLEVASDLRWRPPLLLRDDYAGAALVEQLVKKHRIEFSRGVIKDPEFTFLYPYLRERFPEARFVMIMRDPRDNVRSILNRLEIPGDRAYIDLSAYPEVSEEWRRVLESRYLGVEQEHYVERLAARWSRAAEVYRRHQDALHLIRYEDFCANKTGAIADLAHRLGLPPVHTISDQVDVQYQPRGDRDVSWTAFFGERNLQRIEQVCAEGMGELGYDGRMHAGGSPGAAAGTK